MVIESLVIVDLHSKPRVDWTIDSTKDFRYSEPFLPK